MNPVIHLQPAAFVGQQRIITGHIASAGDVAGGRVLCTLFIAEAGITPCCACAGMALACCCHHAATGPGCNATICAVQTTLQRPLTGLQHTISIRSSLPCPTQMLVCICGPLPRRQRATLTCHLPPASYMSALGLRMSACVQAMSCSHRGRLCPHQSHAVFQACPHLCR